ncbi:acyl carrier protein [Streptomyces triticiradicis]|uniref:Acyl carrier protein n=1 Tax=Streptomyces triticiradicis TaxID=2651189 RepID=A0A7J5DPQ6_9ACTN|nr:acyl carrier protein [Streptomyces triticiradicis]KAB1990749.1 acyl carrier protein [Streptomyces triticiradicis]
MIAEMIGVPEPSPDDSFVELGGDSLTALQVAIVAEERWGAEVDVQEIVVGTVREIHERLLASIRSAAPQNT